MPDIQRVRLPERFYLPRQTYSGLIVHDQVPWDGAVSYVTDGMRYGLEMQDGSISWLEDDPVERFAEDFAGIDLDDVLSGIRKYVAYRQELRGTWARLDDWDRDLAALEQLQARKNGSEPQ